MGILIILGKKFDLNLTLNMKYSQSHSSHLEKGKYNYHESNDVKYSDFMTDWSIKTRHAFIRKVYTILTLCLFVTFGFLFLCCVNTDLANFFHANYWISIVGGIIAIVCMLVLFCKPKVATQTPHNYVLLSAIVVGYSLMFASLGAYYPLNEIAMAAGITLGITFSLTLFAFQVKYDFTKWYPYLLVFFLVLFLCSLVGWFIRSEAFHIFIAGLGVFIFSSMIVLDTQMIVGGKRKMQFSEDQYIMAVITLYLDIIQLFRYVLQLIGMLDE